MMNPRQLLEMLWCLLVLFTLCHFSSSQEASTCPPERQARVKFTVRSQRSQTGHWTSHAQVEQDTNKWPNIARWNVELLQRTQDCEGRPPIILEATVTSPPVRAGPGYALIANTGYYKFHTTPSTWDEAEDICENEGAHLAIINSVAESGILRDLFSQHRNTTADDSTAHIGFHDKDVEGQYVTVLGDPLGSTGFTQWSTMWANQPDNYQASDTHPGEDCGSIHTDGLLNDINCNSKHGFICEQEL